MSPTDIAAILVTVAAICGYLNHKVLHLPATTGTLAVALLSSLLFIALDALVPGARFDDAVRAFVGSVNFDETLMRGMLAFLLFAGALHLDLGGLVENRWTIGALAVAGVLVSTAIVGVLTFWTLHLIGIELSLMTCLAYGALISPTDPVAVIGLLRDLAAPKRLESQIAGESLFNDGIGVVTFLALAPLAGLSPDAGGESATSVVGLGALFLREVAGGALLGAVLGWIAFRALRSLDDYPLELLITLALAMFVYSSSFWIGVSGPIAVVLAGLLIGNPGRRLAMSSRTREHVDAFWSMIDQILNAVLFLLVGLEVVAVPLGLQLALAALASIPIALIGRMGSVALPVAGMRVRGRPVRGMLPVLTWSGLRGGISIAMVLSLPPVPARDTLVACTYAVVVFSILVQGLTVRRVLRHYGIGGAADRSLAHAGKGP